MHSWDACTATSPAGLREGDGARGKRVAHQSAGTAKGDCREIACIARVTRRTEIGGRRYVHRTKPATLSMARIRTVIAGLRRSPGRGLRRRQEAVPLPQQLDPDPPLTIGAAQQRPADVILPNDYSVDRRWIEISCLSSSCRSLRLAPSRPLPLEEALREQVVLARLALERLAEVGMGDADQAARARRPTCPSGSPCRTR